MQNSNGKSKTFRRLLSKDKIHRFQVKPGDYFYTKIPPNSKRDHAQMVLHELRCIFPRNQVFVIPDNVEIHQLSDEDLEKLGLKRIPRIKDVKQCPKCLSGSTMKEYSGTKYRKVCLDKNCGFTGGWREKAELEKPGGINGA